MSTKYLVAVFCLVWSSVLQVRGQQTQWTTEVQTSFIDISGLFGLNEPTQVTTLQYRKKRFFVDGFHSFSWLEPGKVVQTFFGAGGEWKLDTTGIRALSFKSDFAFNRVAADGSFLRPMLQFRWQTRPGQSFHWSGWAFIDTRREALQPLNGGITYFAYRWQKKSERAALRNESRIVLARIIHVRDIAGLTHQTRYLWLQSGVYAVVNLGYAFYRSDQVTEFIWNAGVGKVF